MKKAKRMSDIEKLSAEEQAALQVLHAEWRDAEVRLQGALRMLAAIRKLPDGAHIDPQTGVITRPEPKTEAG